MPPKKMKPIKWDSPEGAGRGGWGAAAPPARLPQHDNGSEELLREIAELKQEIAMKDAAFNALLMAKDAEIRRLHADLARSCAAAGGAARPAHARAAGSDGVATSASVPPQLQPPAAFTAAPVATASLPRTTSQLRVKPVRGPAHAPKAETSVVFASKRPRSSVPAALFDQFKYPEFCDFDSKGNIVVSDHDNHCIQVLRYSDGTILRSFGRTGKAGDGPVSLRNPCAFVIANGLIIVADYGNHRVQVLNYATGEFVRSFRFASKGKSSESQTYPTSVAINRGGSNIAVKFSNGTIQIFQLDGKLLSTFGQQGSGDGQFSGEGHIAYDKNDNLVVSDSDNNRIQVLNSKGIFQRSIGVGDRSGGLKHPVGFTFDESGESDRIIVADCANNRVQVLQYSNGSHIRTIGSSAQLDRPYHVCIDSEKRYVVADSGHGKLQFLT